MEEETGRCILFYFIYGRLLAVKTKRRGMKNKYRQYFLTANIFSSANIKTAAAHSRFAHIIFFITRWFQRLMSRKRVFEKESAKRKNNYNGGCFFLLHFCGAQK